MLDMELDSRYPLTADDFTRGELLEPEDFAPTNDSILYSNLHFEGDIAEDFVVRTQLISFMLKNLYIRNSKMLSVIKSRNGLVVKYHTCFLLDMMKRIGQ